MGNRSGLGPPVLSDSLGSSPTWKTYTTDGATDLNFYADGGGPTRAIRVDTAGNYTLTMVTPVDSAAPTDALPFQAGETQNVQATKLTAASSPSGAKVTAFW